VWKGYSEVSEKIIGPRRYLRRWWCECLRRSRRIPERGPRPVICYLRTRNRETKPFNISWCIPRRTKHDGDPVYLHSGTCWLTSPSPNAGRLRMLGSKSAVRCVSPCLAVWAGPLLVRDELWRRPELPTPGLDPHGAPGVLDFAQLLGRLLFTPSIQVDECLTWNRLVVLDDRYRST
jgi:hypothetical protein